jgi:two-component system, cell cycle sensor histidine kinase and response regulator CckA
MIESFQKQVPMQSLPAFNMYRKFRLKETDLNEVARTVEGILPHYMPGNIGAKVTLSEKDLRIMADIALMREALINLVKNAMDAMPDGGTFSLNTKRVNFESRSISEVNDGNFGPCAFISLVDTGIGIEENIRERIFEPYFTTKTGNGKGLGLPVAYHIIKEHGGTMKVESTPGQGTAIHVYLPLATPAIVNMVPIPLPAPYGRNLSNNGI